MRGCAAISTIADAPASRCRHQSLLQCAESFRSHMLGTTQLQLLHLLKQLLDGRKYEPGWSMHVDGVRKPASRAENRAT